MITPSVCTRARLMCLLLGSVCALAGLSTLAYAGAGTTAETAVSVADLEHLVQRIADPQQRDELVKTLQALILVGKQGHAGAPVEVNPDLFPDHSQGLLFAVGALTQHLAMSGRRVIHGITRIPIMLGELPTHLQDPATLWSVTAIALATVIVMVIGLGLQLFTRHLEGKLRARITLSQPHPWQRKAWCALLSVGLTTAPYVALLGFSGVVFDLLSAGPIPAGVAAVVILTFLLYRFLHVVARVLLDPDAPNARLLPLDDNATQQTWRWVSRLNRLIALYFLITRTLLTIGVAEEFYHVMRGVMILVIATVLSTMLSRLGQSRRPITAASEDERPRPWSSLWATVWTIWPNIAVVYIWWAAIVAILSGDDGVASLVLTSLQMAVLIGAGLALIWGVDLLFQHAAVQNERIGRYIPGLEKRTQRYLQVLWWGSRVLVVLVVLLTLLQVWGVGIAWLVTSPLATALLSRLVTLIVTAACVVCVVDLSTFISQKLVEPSPAGAEPSRKRKTLVPLTATVLKYGALCTGGLIVLQQMGVNITPILAGVGILSLAVGFGAQTLVKDMINGLFMLVEDSLAVGDVVTIRGTGGVVEAVNLRTIRLRDLQGSVHIIPNSQVEMITNMTKDYAYYLVDVGVSYHEDTDEVITALQEIDAEIRADAAYAADILAPMEILGVDRFTDSAVVLRARLQTKPLKQWSVGREFNRRMKKLFDARGIELPFPRRMLSWDKPKRGGAVALQLHLDNPDALAATMGQSGHGSAGCHQGSTETR